MTDEQRSILKLELVKQKEGIIKQRLKKAGLLYKLNNSDKRRFKKIMIEVDENAEHVWVDNNTIEGLHVVSFMKMKDDETELKYF